MAGVDTPSEFAGAGDDTKRVHLGRASSMGLESALLAKKGLQGPVTVIEDLENESDMARIATLLAKA